MFKSTILSCLAAASILALQGCGVDSHADEASGPYLHQVETREIVLESAYQVAREFAGEIQAGQSSQVAFEFPGRVETLVVNIGDPVSAGDLLASLDTRLLQSERDELNAQRSEVEAELDTTRRNLERIQRLQSEHLASERELDDLTGRKQVLEASLQRIGAALEANTIRLEKAELRAPFDAVVASRLIDSGTVVDAGTPVFRLVQSGVREIRAGVPVGLAAQLGVDDEIPVRRGADQTTGTLLGLAPEVDQATRSRVLRVRVHENWQPGDLAYVQIDVPVQQAGAWVPDTAVTEGTRGTWVVYAARGEDDSTSVLEARSVVIHHVRENELYVSGALAGGDQVVASGLQRLAPGQVVRARAEQVLADAH